MGNVRHVVLVALAVILATALGRAGHAAEMRFALVIGNDEYKSAKLATPANDAGLIANALQAAGFTVTGARNLDQATLRESFREFVDQLAAAGPDAVAFVYLAGFGLQFEGENYFVPVDADPQRDVDIPLQAVRMSDFMQPLAALPGRVKIVILDAARQNQFARGGQPLAGGLALVDPGPNMAIAFNAAPGTVGPDEQGPYGAYATSLTEMIAAGGLGLDDVFARVRLRVSELTNGGEIPWYASQIEGPFFFTDRVADAPPPPSAVPLADLRSKPMRGYSSAEDAYEAALAMDTMEAYEQFLAAYPDSPFARRISAMLAVRREEIIWRRSCMTERRQPTGHICAAIRAGRTSGMRGGDWRGSAERWSRRLPSPSSTSACRRRRRSNWNSSGSRCWFSGGRASRRRLRRPSSFCRRGRANLLCCLHPRRHANAFLCRHPQRQLFPRSSGRRAPWRRLRRRPAPHRLVAVRQPLRCRPRSKEESNPGAPGTKPAAPAAAPSSAAVTPAPVPPPPSSTAPCGCQARQAAAPGDGSGASNREARNAATAAACDRASACDCKAGNATAAACDRSRACNCEAGNAATARDRSGACGRETRHATAAGDGPPRPRRSSRRRRPAAPATGPAPATVKPANRRLLLQQVQRPRPSNPRRRRRRRRRRSQRPLKPAPPPPPPPAAAPKPAAAKPAPPPPPPAASPPAPAAGKPACPPGKTLAQVNGHPTCK